MILLENSMYLYTQILSKILTNQIQQCLNKLQALTY